MYLVTQIDFTQTTLHNITQVKQFAMKYYLTVSSLIDFPTLALFFAISPLNYFSSGWP